MNSHSTSSNGKLQDRGTLPPASSSAPNVRHRQLKVLAEIGGSNFRLLQPELGDDDVVLHGDFRREQLRSGLILHATDMRQLHDLKSEAVQPPGMTFALFLNGGAKTWVGDRPFFMGTAAEHRPNGLEAVATCRTRPDSFVRYSARGDRIRKVTINISPEWLENVGFDGLENHSSVLQFARDHLSSIRWQPSPRLVAIAEQMLHPPVLLPLMHNLYCESRAIEFIGEAFQAVTRSTSEPASATLRPHDYRRVAMVCSFLEANLDRPLSLEAIARDVGIGVNTLQRLFRAMHGTTVFEYTRTRKLHRARQALETEGVSVAQAAFIAGYASAANFATAFKRQFGTSPKNVRAQL